MNTKAARQMAEKRDDFMKRFLEEWGDILRQDSKSILNLKK